MVNPVNYDRIVENIECYLIKDKSRHPTIGRLAFQQKHFGYLCELIANNSTFWLKILLFPNRQYLLFELIPSITIPVASIGKCIERFQNTFDSEKTDILLYPSFDKNRVCLKYGYDFSSAVPNSYALQNIEDKLVDTFLLCIGK